MITSVYYKRGDMSSARGFVIGEIVYNDNSFGKPDVHGQEIDENEYQELSKLFVPEAKHGFEGIVNEEGYRKFLEKLSEMEK